MIKKDSNIKVREYKKFFNDVVDLVETNRIEAVHSVQNITNKLYWEIGELIIEKQERHGWGRNVVEKLSLDLRDRLGAAVSWSPRNLWFMRQLVYEYTLSIREMEENKYDKNTRKNANKKTGNALRRQVFDDSTGNAILKRKSKKMLLENDLTTIKSTNNKNAILKRNNYELEEIKALVLDTPWRQNILILQKVKNIDARMFYLKLTVKNKYTTSVLEHQILAQAYENYLYKPAPNNFSRVMPEHLLEQITETVKSVYTLDFLDINQSVSERTLETSMVERVKRLIMELGYGFCFIGNQYRLTLGEHEYFLDLLFYHRILKCLVAVELKTKGFEPDFIGKLDFYLQIIDEQLKQPDDKPSIGLLLVPSGDKLQVEYALRGASKPIGVAQYKLSKNLPGELKGKLPTAKDFQGVFELMGLKNM